MRLYALFWAICGGSLGAQVGGRGRSGSGPFLGAADADASGQDHLSDVGAAASVVLSSPPPMTHFLPPTMRGVGVMGVQEGWHAVYGPYSLVDTYGGLSAVQVTHTAMPAYLHAVLIHPINSPEEQVMHLGFDVGLHGGLLEDWVAVHGAAIAPGSFDVLHKVFHGVIRGKGSTAAAVLRFHGGAGHLPSLVVATYKVVSRNAHVVQDDVVLVMADQEVLLLDGQTIEAGSPGFRVPVGNRVS